MNVGAFDRSSPASPRTDSVTGVAPRVEPFAVRIEAAEIEPLMETLSALRGRKLALLLNLGNRGDGVIHLGARQLLSSMDLTWQEIREAEAPAKIDAEVLLVTGAGAFSRGTHTLPDLVEAYAPQVQQVVILPSSFDLESARVRRFVQTWDDKYTVFCREKVSYGQLTRAGLKAKTIYLSHDLAFWNDLQSWALMSHAGTVGIFRRDREAVFDRRPLDLPGMDISRGPDTQPERLLDYVARFSVVHTDRTHAAITAAMMGREVWFYRNAYFKNQAIYEHSLSHLQHVRFIGKQPVSLRQLVAVAFTRYVRRNAYVLRQRLRNVLSRRSASSGASTLLHHS